MGFNSGFKGLNAYDEAHCKWKRSTCIYVKESEFCQIGTAAKLNLLKPTGYVMHQQFNIQQLYALPTPYLCVLYLSQNKQQRVPLTA